MMPHQDGSWREWLAGREAMDLIVTMDDAASAIHSALLTPREGAASTFRALAEVFSAHGLRPGREMTACVNVSGGW